MWAVALGCRTWLAIWEALYLPREGPELVTEVWWLVQKAEDWLLLLVGATQPPLSSAELEPQAGMRAEPSRTQASAQPAMGEADSGLSLVLWSPEG